jgi:hypothetical protein
MSKIDDATLALAASLVALVVGGVGGCLSSFGSAAKEAFLFLTPAQNILLASADKAVLTSPATDPP